MFASELTARGYSVVSPDYPLFDDENSLQAAGGEKAGYEKIADSLQLAYEYLKHHEEDLFIDMSQAFIVGCSAGGWGAFHTLAKYPGRYRAFVNCWGVPEILPDLHLFPPTISIHGTDDQLVPFAREAGVITGMQEAAIPFELIKLDGEGHTPLGSFKRFMPQILSWMDEHRQ